jgi:ribonuclease HI
VVANVIVFTDGGCKPNPGFAGYGVFGYTYNLHERYINTKHPGFSNLHFSKKGIETNKCESGLEVCSIIEYIGAIGGSNSTNNQAELLGAIKALELCKDLCSSGDNLDIYTDSGYIVSAYNENLDKWVSNGWVRLDGKDLTHKAEWEIILHYKNYYKSLNVNLTFNWVKGHDGTYGNHVSDIYSTIGANASRVLNGSSDFCVYSNIVSYKDYKESYNNKDFIYTFKNLYFSTNELVDDKNYCFLHSGEDEEVGKKSLSNIFAVNLGYVPEPINKVKRFYRSLRDNHVSMCCVKLSKFTDKDVLRLFNIIDPVYLLVESNSRKDIKSYSLVRDTTNFITEIDNSFPFIMNANRLFSRMYDLKEDISIGFLGTIVVDITDRIVQSNKITMTTKDKYVDITDIVNEHYSTPHIVNIKIGSDICNYLGLKNIESAITNVCVVLQPSECRGYLTIYTLIKTADREVYICNIDNKYLVFKKTHN